MCKHLITQNYVVLEKKKEKEREAEFMKKDQDVCKIDGVVSKQSFSETTLTENYNDDLLLSLSRE